MGDLGDVLESRTHFHPIINDIEQIWNSTKAVNHQYSAVKS